MVVGMGEIYSDDSLDFGVDSSEDTEDASETDQAKADEGKERGNVVHEKVQCLRDLLRQLHSGALPGYLTRLARLQAVYEERLFRASADKDLELQMIDSKYEAENHRLKDEYEAKKVDLKENLLASFEEKKKMIEAEHHSVELTGAPLDSLDNRPSFTRKLRRRQNEPVHEDTKQNKAPSECRVFDYMLTETDVEDDLLQILPPHKADKIREKRAVLNSFSEDKDLDKTVTDLKVEDGRLYYDRKWYGRYQNVFVECREFGKIPAVIQSICSSDIVLKKVTDLSKMKIAVTQLQKGRYTLKRRC